MNFPHGVVRYTFMSVIKFEFQFATSHTKCSVSTNEAVYQRGETPRHTQYKVQVRPNEYAVRQQQ